MFFLLSEPVEIVKLLPCSYEFEEMKWNEMKRNQINLPTKIELYVSYTVVS